MPQEFELYLSYCRSLKFEEKPDIAYLRKLFKDLFYTQGLEYDFVFDWMVKKPAVTNNAQQQLNAAAGAKPDEANLNFPANPATQAEPSTNKEFQE